MIDVDRNKRVIKRHAVPLQIQLWQLENYLLASYLTKGWKICPLIMSLVFLYCIQSCAVRHNVTETTYNEVLLCLHGCVFTI